MQRQRLTHARMTGAAVADDAAVAIELF
jgi:hypothetical protein